MIKREVEQTFLCLVQHDPHAHLDSIETCKPPFGGSEYVLHYLGAYTHRVAISHHRLVSLHGDQVTFRWRDSTHANQQRLMTLSVEEFCGAFSSTCFSQASCASATSVSWPTAGALPIQH